MDEINSNLLKTKGEEKKLTEELEAKYNRKFTPNDFMEILSKND